LPAIDRSTVGYVIAGIVLSIFVGYMAFIFVSSASMFSSMFNVIHSSGHTATTVTQVAVEVGTTTINMNEPVNEPLKTHFDVLVRILHVILNVLGDPFILAVLIALSMVAYVLSRK